jgi:hypothetical protein
VGSLHTGMVGILIYVVSCMFLSKYVEPHGESYQEWKYKPLFHKSLHE